jgi:tRNA (guanine6-N2)-methyltransferase
MDWFVTTPLGVEDITAGEVEELVGSLTSVDVGKVFFKAPLEAMYLINYSARTVNRLYLLLVRDYFEDLNDIYRIAKNVDYTTVITPDKSFAVRCERIGNHIFTSVDVARVVGQAVIDSFMESRGVRLRVNLDEPDVEVGVFVRFNEVLIGVNTTGESLHRRRYRVYNHPAALKTTLAASMLRLGNYFGQPLLDPLCGGGTIPIEAAHKVRRYPIILFRKDYYFVKLPIHDVGVDTVVKEKLLSSIDRCVYDITCIDISPKHVDGAKVNVKSALVDDTVRILNRDSTRVESFKDVNAELIVTNPPYGMRSHNLKKIKDFYKVLLKTLRNVYSGVKTVLITASVNQFEEAATDAEVSIIHSRKVVHGGLPAKIYVIKL